MTQETKHTGYRSKEYGIPTKRYCQCLELRDNQELIAKYREVHDEEHVWKEVIEGIRKVGILEMEIYIAGTHLVMIVDTALDLTGIQLWQNLPPYHVKLNGRLLFLNSKAAPKMLHPTKNGS